jgi:hypothetical protein
VTGKEGIFTIEGYWADQVFAPLPGSCCLQQ